MDYKDLIKRLKSETYWLGSSQPYSRDVHPVICDEAVTAITELLSRAEAAEARCALLDEARENANEACAKWEGMYRMALERAEKDIEGAKPKEVLEAIDSLVEFAREHMSIADWLYYANTIGPWRGEKEDLAWTTRRDERGAIDR